MSASLSSSLTSTRSFDEVKELVKERVDLAGAIAKHTKLIKSGQGFKACCPLPGHSEKTPSFHVNTEKNYFYCYGCNRGGDVFSFMEMVEGLPFFEALKLLADEQGIELPKTGKCSPEVSEKTRNRREQGFEILKRATQFYQRHLLEGTDEDAKRAREYLESRGIDVEEIKRLQLGWAPAHGMALTKKIRSEDVDISIAAALLRNRTGRNYDFFRNRLLIPIADPRGRVVAYSGRTLDEVSGDNPKYINTPETDWFHKKNVVYGLDRVRRYIAAEGWICFVEGYFDQWAFERAEVPAVAVMGTAIGEDHLKLLERYTKTAVLVMDSDEAGRQSIRRSLSFFVKAGWQVRVFSAFDGKDPDEWLAENKLNSEKLKQKLLAAPTGVEWFAQDIAERGNAKKKSREALLRDMLEVWRLCQSASDKESVVDLLEPLGFSRTVLVASLNKLMHESKEGPQFTRAQESASYRSSFQHAPHQNFPTRQRGPVTHLSHVDRVAEECFLWWTWHWDLLWDASDTWWAELEELFSGSPFAALVGAWAQNVRENGKLPRLETWRECFFEGEDLAALEAKMAKALVPIAEKSTQDKDKALESFKELRLLYSREKLAQLILSERNKLRRADLSEDEVSTILQRVQDLRIRLEESK